MSKAKSEAGKWLEANGAKWRADKPPPQGKFSKKASCGILARRSYSGHTASATLHKQRA